MKRRNSKEPSSQRPVSTPSTTSLSGDQLAPTATGNRTPPSILLAEPARRIEHDIQRELFNQPGLQFSSLVIRRVRDGVCLEGVVEADEQSPDVCSLVRAVAGVKNVMNHLVIRRRFPPKG